MIKKISDNNNLISKIILKLTEYACDTIQQLSIDYKNIKKSIISCPDFTNKEKLVTEKIIFLDYLTIPLNIKYPLYWKLRIISKMLAMMKCQAVNRVLPLIPILTQSVT